MDDTKPGHMEFLDLTGIDEQERTWILSSIHSWNPNIKLPWWSTQHEPLLAAQPQKQLDTNYNQPTTIYMSPPPPPPPAAFITQHAQAVCYYAPQYPLNHVNYNNFNEEYVEANGVPIAEVEDVNNIEEEVEQNGNVTSPLPLQQQQQQPPPTTPKSWASLFNNTVQANIEVNQKESYKKKIVEVSVNNIKVPVNNNVSPIQLKEPFKSNADDPNLHRMGEFLSTHNVDNHVTSLQPRGLINRSNYCYINSILQALLACPPVYNLLNGLMENSSAALEKKKITPNIDSMIRFIREFHHLPAGMRMTRRPDKNQKKEYNNIILNCDTPFEPFWMHKLLNGMRSDTFVVEGRQEDAEEFLGCLLNGLNDEMLELMKLVGNCPVTHHDYNLSSQDEEDKEWQVMGPKNKGAITRRTELNRTPISDIFGGLLRTRLHRTGDQSTDNIQPFFTLQLNIEKAMSVREALEVLVCKNQLEGVTSSKTNEEVEAWQQVTLEELPIVLVLHLKCFDYKLDGCSKIIKVLEFPIDLKVDSRLLSSKTNYTAKEKQYKLFAVVYHEGKEASKGHYVTDAYHVGYASWLRYDDASVKAVPEEHVLKPHGTRVPYLLFYRRSDSLNKTK